MAETAEIVCNPDTDVFAGRDYPSQLGTCLVIMPFKNKTDKEKQIQDVFTEHIKKVVENCGLQCKRADNNDVLAGKARMNQIWQLMCAADIVIGEFSIPNINVTYEMGIAHTLGKPMIGIVQKGKELPFDYQHLGFIVYENIARGREQLEKDLKAQIELYKKTITPDNQYPKRVATASGASAEELAKTKKEHAGEIARLQQQLAAANKRIGELTKPLPAPLILEVGKPYPELFGGRQWLVLDVDRQNNRALLLSEEIITKLPYHKPDGAITWERCSLREYLNGEFCLGFSEEERGKIVETLNQNPNMEYDTADDKRKVHTWGGNPTQDRVFLLSTEEAKKYFRAPERETPQSYKNYWPKTYLLNNALIAKHSGQKSWWWLRSPGYTQSVAVTVRVDGSVSLFGDLVRNDVGVRPALWLQL